MKLRVSMAWLSVLVGFASLSFAQAPVDYSVYFIPQPSAPPEVTNLEGSRTERKFAIVYNVGQTSGTHSYRLLLRAYKPGGGVACETTVNVQPWAGHATQKKVASFQVIYKKGQSSAAIPPGRYPLRAYLTEQIPQGETRQDAFINNNQYPLEPPDYLPFEFEVRPGADEVRCVPATRERHAPLPAGLKVPAPRQ